MSATLASFLKIENFVKLQEYFGLIGELIFHEPNCDVEYIEGNKSGVI